MRCQSPFLAGNPEFPETFLTATGCTREATHRVKHRAVKHPRGGGAGDAETCAQHLTGLVSTPGAARHFAVESLRSKSGGRASMR